MNSLKVTSEFAIYAKNTIALLEDISIKTGGTYILAGPAIGAEFSGDSPEEGESAQNTEKSTEGTEVFTPVTFFKTFKEEDEEEKQERDECEGIKGFPEG